MKSLARTNQFKRDYKKAKKRGRDISKLLEMVTRLASGEKLEPSHKAIHSEGSILTAVSATSNQTGC